MPHVPALGHTRSSHMRTPRTTHIANAYEEQTVVPPQEQTQQESKDASFGTQNIQNGSITMAKLRLEDEFGATTLLPSGFRGSWEDFVNTSIYNGSFADNKSVAPAALGRTAHVPYWTLTQVTGTPTFLADPGALAIDFATATHKGSFESDKVRVRQGVPLQVFINDYNSGGNGDLHRVIKVKEYSEDGTLRATKTVLDSADLGTFSGTRGRARFATGIIPRGGANSTVPTSMVSILVEVDAPTVSASPRYQVTEVGLIVARSSSGTAFPPEPGTGDLADRIPANTTFFRTDLGMEFFWDFTNSQWLSTQLFVQEFGRMRHNADWPISVNATDYNRMMVPDLQGGSDIWLVSHRTVFFVVSGGSALGASHKWVGNVTKFTTTPTQTTIATVNIDSGSSGVYRSLFTSIQALLNNGTTHFIFATDWTKTGTPGDLHAYESLTYRIVAI